MNPKITYYKSKGDLTLWYSDLIDKNSCCFQETTLASALVAQFVSLPRNSQE